MSPAPVLPPIMVNSDLAITDRVRFLEAENRRLSLRVLDLEQQLWARRAQRAKDDALDALSLFPVADVPAAIETPKPSARGARGIGPQASSERTAGRRPLDPSLPRELIRLPDPPAADRVCSLTGVPLQPGFTEQIEVLVRKPAEYLVHRYERTVWVSAAKSAPLATPWPSDVLPRHGVHVSVVAHIATAHFSDHMPYYRIEKQLARTGILLPRSTQVALMARLTELVAPVVAHIRSRIMSSGYVHLDATPVDVCDRTRPGAARSASLWAYRARSRDPDVEGLVWFDYQATKSPVHPGALLRESKYRGIVQTDGAAGLDTLAPPEHVTHLGCWAHARRYLADALNGGDTRAAVHLARVDRLFRIESRVRRTIRGRTTQNVDDPVIARVESWRMRFSVPLMEAIFAGAAEASTTLPPRTALAVAIGYLLGQRASLARCVTTPGAYLDNNAAENAIRPLKVGSKNWLFVGHPDAGPRLATLFTLVENCRQAGVDPEAYVVALLTRLGAGPLSRPGDWLPRAWERVRTSAGVSA